jgi:hypothetical protein
MGGQWYEREVASRACCAYELKVASHSALQNTRSNFAKDGFDISLLQVNFRFCNGNSVRSITVVERIPKVAHKGKVKALCYFYLQIYILN